MKIKEKWLIPLLGILMIAGSTPAFSQNKVGTTAAPFLTIGVGARPQAMGGAFVSMVDDAHALYWNPAGLSKIRGNEFLLIHSTWLADMSFEFIGGAVSMGQMGTLGFSATYLNVGEMEQTTELNQEGTGLFFNSYDLAAAVHYGYAFYDKFSLGGSVKYIRQVIWNEKASGFALDLGTLYITPFYDTRLGMSISNFGTKLRMEGRDLVFLHDPSETKQGNNDRVSAEVSTDEWKLPLTLRLGLSGELIHTNPNRLTWAVDWVVPNDNTEFLNAGAEYAYNENYFLRAGYRGIRPGNHGGGYSLADKDNGSGFTAGGGINFNLQGTLTLKVDYAYESFERLGSIHKYSLGLRF